MNLYYITDIIQFFLYIYWKTYLNSFNAVDLSEFLPLMKVLGKYLLPKTHLNRVEDSFKELCRHWLFPVSIFNAFSSH